MTKLHDPKIIEQVVIDNDLDKARIILEKYPKSSKIKLWRFSIRLNRTEIFRLCVNEYNFDINTHLSNALIEAIEYKNNDIVEEFFINKNYKLNISELSYFLNIYHKDLVLLVYKHKDIYNKIKSNKIIDEIVLSSKIKEF